MAQDKGESRRAIDEPTSASASSPAAAAWPSWSWAGWTNLPPDEFRWGLLRSPEFDGVDHVVSKVAAHAEVIPTVDWSTGDRPDLTAGERRPIQSRRWFEAKDTFKGPDRPLRPGWSRSRRKLDRLYAGQAPRAHNQSIVYTHASAPDKLFWYLIPMEDPTGDPARPRVVRPRYLFGTVEHIPLYIHRSDWQAGAGDTFVEKATEHGIDSQLGTQVLRDEAGSIVGVLDVHVPDAADVFHGKGALDQTRVEFVAISRCQTLKRNELYTGANAKMVKNSWSIYNENWYECYNVVWVEWAEVSGVRVGSRKALGRVSKDV
ncbi:hypothetical protein QBC33DRAFT_556504 [Phialemonium atrogriseum]|uniref:Uncharacterized protein n=1 Tax=Phialemonium atrogriseum TaxID=1093897 RepID=A0AAJ0FRF3_9PEZI|nr:uncharacterized protein QBC33DRAFT_556504 [Phialemonium atrogriseum]KAK1770085.1 hypothetical protein QBC33DRAFT_556504 [Phialemonium atrogriseum]